MSTWNHVGGGRIVDSAGKHIGQFIGDFKDRDRLICAVNEITALRAEIESLRQQVEQGKRDAVPEGWVAVPVIATEEMVSAYLHANRNYWTEHDKQQRQPDKWRNGTPQEATAESYVAMISAAPKQEK